MVAIMDGRQGAILLGLLFMVLVSGCAGSSGGSKDSSRGNLSEVMTEKVVTIAPNASIGEAAREAATPPCRARPGFELSS